jgi:3-oxoacyl-[acyl-carrier-protein] synthase-3
MSASAIYLSAVAACFPARRERALDAIAAGRYEDKYLETTGYESVAAGTCGQAPVDLAVQAAQAALGHRWRGQRIDLITYSSVHRQAHPQLWVPAAYLQRALAAPDALAFSIAHGCNAQLLACEVAFGLMRAGRAKTALVTGADIFSGSGFDRWRSDFVAYGDAGAAMSFGFETEGARVLHLAATSDPELESMHRGETPFAETAPDYQERAFDVRARKRAFLQTRSGEELVASTRAAMTRLWQQIAWHTGWGAEDIDHFVFPNLGAKVLESSYFPPFPAAQARSAWDFGRTVGHLGTSDCAAGLAHLITAGRIKLGDRVLLIGAGAGFSWSMLALSIEGLPHAALLDEGPAERPSA